MLHARKYHKFSSKVYLQILRNFKNPLKKHFHECASVIDKETLVIGQIQNGIAHILNENSYSL